MIIGTAGHIDHGKTALVKALTGVDTDRLQEEKARGITIDLGYAYVPLADGEALGFIDVPGHERFIHNMLAGVTGIDYALLVVAADDGPMPQTLEHVQILDLLGLHQGAVALTKIDRVERTRATRVTEQIQTLLQPTMLAGYPIFPVSTVTGEGVPPLRAHLESAALRTAARRAGGHFRLAVDRCFTLAGTGTVVTGTVFSGRVEAGDTLLLSPAGVPVRVRGIHAQNRASKSGAAGQRCALNLTGAHGAQLEKSAVQRGDWVLHPAVHAPAQRLDARLTVLATETRTLKHWTPVHVHLGAADVTARVALLQGETLAPGASAYAQLVLDKPIGALRGDRFIVRDQSARRTVGGGVALDPFTPARGRRQPRRLAVLEAFEQDTPLASLRAMLACAPAGVDLPRFALSWNLADAEMQAVRREITMAVVDVPPTAFGFDSRRWAELEQAVVRALAEEHERVPDELGPDRERLRRLAAADLPCPVFTALLEALLAEKRIARDGPWLHLPEHRVTLTEAEQTLWKRVTPLLKAESFHPPRVRDIARALRSDEDGVRKLLRRSVALGEVYRVAHDHYFMREAMSELARIARQLAREDGEIRAARFRDRIGTGRKLAIQILEFFDAMGFTLRVGEAHRIRQDNVL
ncbi:MAG: selenocysteine-specific translation elongation factor [Gammaproteobacteria bacterium]|nr:selenocysteine-specific translation elongation factor [Gammaproteobacteria bacterium]